MEEKEALERQWFSLPHELLNLIAKSIDEISDFVRFRAVCRAWRFSTPITDHPPQFPWIFEDRRCHPQSNMLFYSLPLRKTYAMCAQKFSGKIIIGSSEGNFLVQLYNCRIKLFSCPSRNQFSFINPLNNHEIFLPACDLVNKPNWMWSQQNQTGEPMFCFGYLNYQSTVEFTFYHLDKDYFFKVNLSFSESIRNFFYLKRMLFGVDSETGLIEAADITTGTLAYVIPPIKGYQNWGTEYLVEVSGDIMRVRQHDGVLAGRFDVYRLDANGRGSKCWVKVNSIGNNAIFIDRKGIFVLEASDLARIKRKCIYYLRNMLHRINSESCPWITRTNIETGVTKHLPFPLKEPACWFLPNLYL